MIQDRKLEHLSICKNYDVNYKKSTGFEDIELIHRALPEINKADIDISTKAFGKKLDSPLFISAITGGHPFAEKINKELSIAAEENNIALGLGSQRAGIENPELTSTYTVARDYAPNALLLGNIGAPQMKYAEDAVNMLDADILAIHLNPLQESIQPGGDVDARGYVQSISEICDLVDVPVMVKETGAGICAEDAAKLQRAGVDFIDVQGSGGTSWAAVETYRTNDRLLGEAFWDWGIPTAISTVEVCSSVSIPVVSSGGIRTGLDAAKAIALGADAVGMALPFLKAAYKGHDAIVDYVNKFNESLKLAMFLVGARSIKDLKESDLVIRGETKEWLNDRGFNTRKYSRRSNIDG
ncbi:MULTISPECIES: type 2 isopentenyl-diphosphate Delta-isomerase [Methanobrevibacter]|jgi:isopentenyl-diphosphate delta-isomerase|uniref:type 2 isopentenyl-diphosphate Delta-isomerase n=1 Tax=Methanobrevibacter TaxID=2172 RepID=UPI000334896E|nr:MULTISPECIES: type 2 isopentenyl-diphosphate Delta-isomerase [Methanobrevibacter]AGN17111.1 isopentenyl diphosphate delta-isomerase Fni [Methanobrevibacter sp. AbM4]MDD6255999.1 type 2 isopentenyl-diphosphate Delta-isomerase [Methanobrevibacter boviskoreani]